MNSYTRKLAWIAVTLLALAPLGCGSSSSSDGPSMDELASRLDPPKPAPAPEQPPAPVAAAQPAPQPAPPQPQTSATALPGGIATSNDPDDLAGRPAARPHVPAVSRGEGDVVGHRVYTNHAGGVLRYYGAVASARNFMEDQILGDTIQHNLDLYVAGNGGNFPKTNDEYMEHVIKENMVKLPELPPGQEYFYDPSDHELKVGTIVEPPADAQPPTPGTPAPATPAPAAAPPAAG